MPEEILINVTPREVRIALLENNTLQEVYIERYLQQGLLGNIYKGRVQRLLPGIQAAFVDIGLERAAFLHISDVRGYDVTPDIRDLLTVGQDILVQVYKDPLGSKGARLTTFFTLPSRYLVLTPYTFQISVSQKITNLEERQRLMSLLTPSDQGGYIFRTVAEGVQQDAVAVDQVFLNTVWMEVKANILQAKPGEIVYEEIPIVLRVLRDLVGYKLQRIRVDSAEAVKQMREYAKRYMAPLVNYIEYYDKDRPIFDLYGVENELQKALQRKVTLKSGGYLIFDQTEAMTTIDVNTGSYLGNNNADQTIFKINFEAAHVIARQLRLRNLGGIIIVDFIDMEDPVQKIQLLQSLGEALAKDSVRTEMSELSRLGLVQLTRKRTRESVEHVLCETCPLCQRRGSIKSVTTVAYDIFREIRYVAQLFPWQGFLVLASQQVVDCVLEEESTMLRELETQLGKPIQVRVELSFTQEKYNILPLSGRTES